MYKDNKYNECLYKRDFEKMYQETYNNFWFTLIALFVTANLTLSQCPWQHDIPDLQTSCVCAYNLGHELSVQCDQVEFSLLMEALNRYTENKSIDLLYVNNSTINKLTNHVFISLRLHNIQLSSCKIRQIEDTSFRGQETILRNLNLQDNLLENVPSKAFSVLNVLNLLDLSKNRIKYISDGVFKRLSKLSTLKLNDNNVTLSPGAFQGIEKSLKNLNLKSTRQKKVPEAIRGLKALAFLDLSQNGIKELPNGFHTFEGLDSLTALNLERNLIQNLGETAFDGIKKTLSSLSLLNNLLAEFPIGAIHSLSTLKVLDIGFNLLTTIPEVAFRGNSNITLLALDGNPLSTVNEKTLSHLKHTLRGLSLGGRFLHCDCKLKWVAEWIQNTGLQVTSRERNPQFCGSPAHFRDRGFYSIQPAELNCPELDVGLNKPVGIVDSLIPKSNTSIASRITSTTPRDATISTLRPSTVTATQSTTFAQTQILPTSALTTMSVGVSIKTSTASVSTVTTSPAEFHQSSSISSVKTQPLWRQNISSHTQQQRPPLVLGYPSQRGKKVNEANEVQVKNAFRQDNSVIIQWDSITANILGFRVVYRLFGEKSFKQGPPLEASEREFKIKNVPSQECIIICVISLEELNVTPDTVSYSQCKEVRTVSSQTSNMDKITISASAAICGTIIVAVIVFIAASRRSRRMQSLKQRQKSPVPIVNCCGPAGIAKPFGSMANLSAFNNQKDWDQVSAYSGRSIPRPRIYSVDNQDDRRSHISHFSAVGKSTKTRSIADGQSQHSLSNNSQRGYLGATFSTDLVNSRPELRLSRQSLSATSERMSRASYVGSIHGPASFTSSSRKSRPRSRNRNQLNGTHIHSHRLGNRYSTVASTHALNNYCDTSDNWTDHDMEIYITRNATTRNGLVPL